MFSSCTVPSRSSAPNHKASCAVSTPVAIQNALMCGTLSSISRATACTRRVSIALGAGSLRIWLLSGWKASGMKACSPPVSSCSARAQHVIDALLRRLDVPVEHRHVGAHPEAVRETMDRQIAVGAALVVADLPADALGENLGAAAGQRIQPGLLQL